MADRSAIEWTDASWNPIRARNTGTRKVGWHCEHATTGCVFCYAEGFNLRLGTGLPFKPGHRENVELFLDEKMLTQPLRWKRPRKVFVCSMTDLFADFVPDEWIDRMFAVMALTPQHTYQVLTKRANRMRQWFTADRADTVGLAMLTIVDRIPYGHRRVPWSLPNVWLGVSTERQKEADERIPELLATPAAVHFISAEPLLGPLDLTHISFGEGDPRHKRQALTGQAYLYAEGIDRNPDMTVLTKLEKPMARLDWVIVGGESGHEARPMHPEWARSLRDQCAAAGVPFFFKQWGQWAPEPSWYRDHPVSLPCRVWDGNRWTDDGGTNGEWVVRVGKKAAGRLLDGVEHNGFPKMEHRNGV